MLLFNKIEFLSMECTFFNTFPPILLAAAMPPKTIIAHPSKCATSLLASADTGPAAYQPPVVKFISNSDKIEVEPNISHNMYILGDCIEDVPDAKSPSSEHRENEKFELFYASLSSFPNHEGNEYSTRAREEDISLTGLMQPPAASGSSASCPPSSQMWYLHEEQGEICSALSLPQDENKIGFEQQAFFNNDQLVWDAAQDDEILSGHYALRKNIVFDSICPELIPHIVLTPVDETWNDQLTAWENRVEPQWMGNLTVPIINATWPPPEPFFEPTTDINYTPSLEGCASLPIAVFSASKLNKLIESASTERLVLCQLVRTLQKQLCRAVAFRASTFAQSFRERYDVSLECFKALESPFVWRDPAEPILIICSKLLGTTIIDSPCPFLLPHIIINTPPPQDFWIQWGNATNDPQDQGFGQYLVVPSVVVGVINPSESPGWESTPSTYFDQAVDQSESPPTPGSSLPDTPVDERDDLDYFLTRHGDVGDAGMDTDCYYQSLRGLPSIQEEYLETENTKLPLRRIFSIEEDEDDLPPLDDWYR